MSDDDLLWTAKPSAPTFDRIPIARCLGHRKVQFTDLFCSAAGIMAGISFGDEPRADVRRARASIDVSLSRANVDNTTRASLDAPDTRERKNRTTPACTEGRPTYRIVSFNDGVVFARQEDAERVARINSALRRARTWREFRAIMPRADYSEIVRKFDFDDIQRPNGADAFSAEQVPGWSDGDYPTWLQQQMDDLLPRRVLEPFGERCDTFLNGSFWMLPHSRSKEIVAALEREGYTVRSGARLQFS